MSTVAPAIRPPDPVLEGEPLTFMPVTKPRDGSPMAIRWLLHLVFRDAHTALDLTYGAGGFWRDPLPPGLNVTGNNPDPASRADLHLDYTATGLPDGAYDIVCFDPPHTADNGRDGHFAGRYGGTLRGNAALCADVAAGAVEAWRVARVGTLVKVIDACHESKLVVLTDCVKAAVGARPYVVLHTVGRGPIIDPKHRAVRVPRNNGATYLAFRKDGHRHRDFDRLYARQRRAADRSAP
jgi:hypothetical protein